MRTRRWLAILAADVLIILANILIAWHALVAHAHDAAVTIAGETLVALVMGATITMIVLPHLNRARQIDNLDIPAPCSMSRYGRVMHLQPYCRCTRP